MTMLPFPIWPLAEHIAFGQNADLRVHWLSCTVLHKHILPWTLDFFNSLPLHRLVGSCASRDAVDVSPTQLGRIWRNILGSSHLPEVERRRGPEHVRKA